MVVNAIQLSNVKLEVPNNLALLLVSAAEFEDCKLEPAGKEYQPYSLLTTWGARVDLNPEVTNSNLMEVLQMLQDMSQATATNPGALRQTTPYQPTLQVHQEGISCGSTPRRSPKTLTWGG